MMMMMMVVMMNKHKPVTSCCSVSVKNRTDERGEISNWVGLGLAV